jgi:hypothetical protein
MSLLLGVGRQVLVGRKLRTGKVIYGPDRYVDKVFVV